MARSILLILTSVLALSKADEVDYFVRSSPNVTLSLYKEAMGISGSSTNGILLSPVSIQTVLALAQSGALGATGEEIRSSLFLPNTTETTETAINSILTTMNAKFANRIYGEQNFTTGEHFKEIVNEIYQADIIDSNFLVSTISTTVNDWVGKQTGSRLGTTFSKATDFTKLTKEFLINTFFTTKNWTYTFPISQTKTESFRYGTATNNVVNVNMMTQPPNYFNYYEDSDTKAKYLELPLNDNNATFTIVLPNGVAGMTDLEKDLEAVFTTPAYTKEYIQVSLPRITMQITYQALTSSMRKLGIQNAFSNSDADFSLIGGAPGGIRMNNVRHSAYIRVDENTVEAVAAGPTDLTVPTTKHFNVNVPFIIYIKVDGVVVLVGKVIRPVITVNN